MLSSISCFTAHQQSPPGGWGTVVDPDGSRLTTRFFTKATPPVAFYQSLSKLGFVVSAAWHEGFRGIVGSYNADGALRDVLAGYEGTGTPHAALELACTTDDGYVSRCTRCRERLAAGEPLFWRSVYHNANVDVGNLIYHILHLGCVSPEQVAHVKRENGGDATQIRGFERLDDAQRAEAVRVFG